MRGEELGHEAGRAKGVSMVGSVRSSFRTSRGWARQSAGDVVLGAKGGRWTELHEELPGVRMITHPSTDNPNAGTALLRSLATSQEPSAKAIRFGASFDVTVPAADWKYTDVHCRPIS